MSTIAILGGTFDPVHGGHIAAAQAVLNSGCADQLWVMPVAYPPHKASVPVATGAQRLRMLQLAFAHDARIHISDFELRISEVSYTLHTVQRLMKAYPDHLFKWIIGADMVQSLPNWFECETLSTLISFVGLSRPGYSLDLGALPPYLFGKIELAFMKPMEGSSSMIRQRLRDREARTASFASLKTEGLLAEAVIRYIEENGLYED